MRDQAVKVEEVLQMFSQISMSAITSNTNVSLQNWYVVVCLINRFYTKDDYSCHDHRYIKYKWRL